MVTKILTVMLAAKHFRKKIIRVQIKIEGKYRQIRIMQTKSLKKGEYKIAAVLPTFLTEHIS